MILPAPYRQSTLSAYAKAAACLVLCLALVAPKVSLAFSSLFGGGYYTVVFCTGSGMTRVTVSPDGTVVEDVSEPRISSPCVLLTDDRDSLYRDWERFAYPPLSGAAHLYQVAQTQSLFERLSKLSIRGPPTINHASVTYLFT